MYHVVIFCPDRHLTYDAYTPDRQGIGGGVTIRIRMAQALARLGHRVTVVANVPRSHVVHAVSYQPLDAIRHVEADVFLMSTSGGALDLRPARSVDARARLRGVWIHGIFKPQGLDETGADYVLSVSNFLRRLMRDEWGVPIERCFVAYPGSTRPRRWGLARRNPFRLVYAGHPEKGLDAAIQVLRLLRRDDPRFELHVYGGRRLWGEADAPPPAEPGLRYHGLVGQSELLRAMEASNVALHLQSVPEGFSLALLQAMAAGCIVVASPVGANGEAVESTRNGFLLPGDHRAEETWHRAAELVRTLVSVPQYADYVRSNAQAVPWTWHRMATVWTQHWTWLLDGRRPYRRAVGGPASCPECAGAWLLLADGHHCGRCGNYARAVG